MKPFANLPKADGKTVKVTVPEPKAARVKDKARDMTQLMKNNIFRRGHGVSLKVLEALQLRFPDWTFEFKEGAARHPHPMGAVERAVCEELAFRDITKMHGRDVFITDIGGNANRHVGSGRTSVHSCNPKLSASDVVRRRPESYYSGANYCHDTAEKCRYDPDVYLSIHSLYYLTRQSILDFVFRSKKGELKAVVHRFDKLYGALHFNGEISESVYSVQGGDKLSVHMKVNGNDVGYTHDPLLWLCTNYFEAGGRAMAWSGYPIGDSWIYTFVKAPTGLHSESTQTLDLIDSLDRDDHYGSVKSMRSYAGGKDLTPAMEALGITDKRFVSMGPFSLVYSRTKTIHVVPKDLIRTVALKMVHVARNKEGLKLCSSVMQAQLRKMNMPAEMKIKCATYGTSMAFIYTLKDEISAFNNLCRPKYLKMFDQLASIMSLTPWGCCGFNQAAEEHDLDNITIASYNDDRSSVPSRAFNARKAWAKGLLGYESSRPLKDLKKNSTVRVPDEPDAREYGPQMHVNCMSFSNYLPVVPNPSRNNEVVALVNRVCMVVPAEDPQVWDSIQQYSLKLMDEFEMEPVEGTDQHLYEQWIKHYDAKTRQRYDLAMMKVARDGLNANDYKVSMFVKRETTMKGGPEVQDFDPRAIQSFSDEVNVVYGPFIWHCANEIKKRWNSEARICYTSGMTGEDIGMWRAQFAHDPVTIFEWDYNRYDGTKKRGAFNNERQMKIKLGIEARPLANGVDKYFQKLSGRTRSGVSYTVEFVMPSGRQDTSCSNTFENGSCGDYCFHVYFGERGLDWKIAVNGDDGVAVVRGILSEEDRKGFADTMTSIMLQAGFDIVVKSTHDWAEVEFCSSLFWPVEGGYVLAPKIGRRLPKIGFGLRPLSLPEIKGMVLGLQIEAGFLPVIRMYVEKALLLLQNVEAAAYEDDRLQYKSFCVSKHEPNEETHLFFLARYGFTSHYVEESFGISLKECVSIYTCMNFPLLELLVDVDVATTPILALT
jgi:hypothetical protein